MRDVSHLSWMCESAVSDSWPYMDLNGFVLIFNVFQKSVFCPVHIFDHVRLFYLIQWCSGYTSCPTVSKRILTHDMVVKPCREVEPPCATVSWSRKTMCRVQPCEVQARPCRVQPCRTDSEPCRLQPCLPSGKSVSKPYSGLIKPCHHRVQMLTQPCRNRVFILSKLCPTTVPGSSKPCSTVSSTMLTAANRVQPCPKASSTVVNRAKPCSQGMHTVSNRFGVRAKPCLKYTHIHVEACPTVSSALGSVSNRVLPQQ